MTRNRTWSAGAEITQTALRWAHCAVGLLGFAAFLLTGQYMDRSLDHLRGMPDAPRALFRSAHIYILFASLLNLLLGVYVVLIRTLSLRVLQYLGSLLLLAAPILFLYGFIVETPPAVIERSLTRAAIELSFAGVALHGIAVLISADRRQRSG